MTDIKKILKKVIDFEEDTEIGKKSNVKLISPETQIVAKIIKPFSR